MTDRFARRLAVATVGVYALVVAGATTAVTGANAACTTWPGCALDEPSAALLVVVLHRLAAAAMGAVVLWVAVAAWRRHRDRRVRGALGAVALAYPVQVGVGAATATGALGGGTVSALHLGLGLGIFGGLVLALAWTLEPARLAGEAAAGGALEGDAAAAAVAAGEVPTRAGEDPLPEGPLGTALAYLRLTKPRLMWLLCLVAGAGMALAAGPTLGARTVLATLGGGVLAIGASGTFNHVLERDVDRRMARTADRPLPAERVPERNAVAFGLALSVLAVATFWTVNALAAALGLAAILYYSVVYTLVLKPNTVQNTVVGGFAGALPALIGWAAVTGSVGWPAVALAGLIFLWTPAHFYNLAMAYREDYARGGFPMLPVVRGDAVARKHVLLYLGATLAAAVVLVALADLGLLFAGTSAALGSVFLWAVLRLHRERSREAAMRAFHASNAYLGTVLVAVVVDAMAL